MERDKLFFLDLSAASKKEINQGIFRVLLALDGEAIGANVDADKESDLSKHLWYVNRHRWSNTLVIYFPRSLLESNMLGTHARPLMPLCWSIRSQSLKAEDFADQPILAAMTLATIASEGKSTVVLVVEGTNTSLLNRPYWPKDIERSVYVVASSDATVESLQSYRSQREFQFAGPPSLGRGEAVGQSESDLKPVDYVDRLGSKYPWWFKQELLSERAEEEFLGIFRMIHAGRHVSETSDIELGASLQYALGALRICRHVARWTLEGTPIECAFILHPDDIGADGGGGLAITSQIRAAYIIDEYCKFSFANMRYLRSLIEIAHISGFFVSISIRDGRVLQLSDLGVESSRHHRHEVLRSVSAANDRTAIIYCANGFVELYASGQLKLWHDGFRWWPVPFRLYKQVFSYFFRNNAELSAKLIAAMSTILDRQESSIICLVADEDMEQFREVVGPPFRTGVRPAKWVSDDFLRCSLDIIVSALHLDGAHFISSNGRLLAWARQIALSGEHDVGLGAGTRAARVLSSGLPRSFVIKTSSSGFVMCFVGGALVRDPEGIQF